METKPRYGIWCHGTGHCREALWRVVERSHLGQSDGAGKLIWQEVEAMVVKDVESDVVRSDDVDGEWDVNEDRASGCRLSTIQGAGKTRDTPYMRKCCPTTRKLSRH